MKSSKALFRSVTLSLLCALALFITTGCTQNRGDDADKPQYTVSFDSDGGSQVAAQTVTEGKTATVPPSPTKTGFVFAGWHLDGELWVFGEDGVSRNITLKAKWIEEKNAEFVSFNSDGGSKVASGVILESGKIEAPQTPTKPGYDFVGWYLGEAKWDFENGTATEGMELKAKWTLASFTITYDLGKNGVGATENPTAYTVLDAAMTLGAPKRAGYKFSGWLVNDGTEAVADFTVGGGIVGNIKLTATWVIDPDYGKYKITYLLGGGSNAQDNPAFFTSGSGTVTILAPTREYYEFLGWTYDGQSEPVTEISFSAPANLSDKVFIAHWRAKTYTIDYVSYGGAHVGNPTSYTAEDLPLSLNGASKDGFYFTGWYSDSDFKTAATVITACDNLTLYADFIVGSAGISYMPNDSGTGYIVTGYNGGQDRVHIAPTYNGLPVVEIADSAFLGSGIVGITIPESVKKIGKLAFGGCASLSSADIPSGIEYIGDGAFSGCTSISKAYTLYGGVYYLGNEDAPYTVAMAVSASGNGAVTLHEDTKIIGSYAFENAASATSITLPDGVVMICDNAFSGLTALSEIIIPDTLKHIGAFAFNNCISLDFTECDGVKYLGSSDNAYMILVKADSTVRELTVKAETTIICAYAFADCQDATVTFEGDKNAVSINAAGNGILFAESEE